MPLKNTLSPNKQHAEKVESHPFAPILPKNAQVMMMGSFPPSAEKRCMEFHYPNFQNDMWRIYGEVFFQNINYFRVGQEKRFDPTKIEAFLIAQGIALCPTVRKAIRQKGNASDKYLQVVEPVDLKAVLEQLPNCSFIFTTGGKATELVLEQMSSGFKLPKTNEQIHCQLEGRNLCLVRLPSTSRAYPLSFTKKVQAYCHFFMQCGML